MIQVYFSIVERKEFMQRIDVKEKNVNSAFFQFIFPFSFQEGSEQNIFPYLRGHQFKHFQLDDFNNESKYYGDFRVSHRDMEAFFLPFTNKILFPISEQQKGIQRYSKPLEFNGYLITDLVRIPFQIHSIDVILCPYELGFITIRTEVKDSTGLSLSRALEFSARFRVLEPRSDRDLNTQIECEGNVFHQLDRFVFEYLFEGLTAFFDKKTSRKSYFGTFPFFEDERMYAYGLISVQETEAIHLVDVYRSISLCGLNQDGEPFISANNLPYIREYLKTHSYQRWAPNTYFTMEEHSLICLTNENRNSVTQLVSQVYGEYYYALLLNLFHKIVLLKIGHAFAEIHIERDANKMEKLIYSINSFTANFFFTELAAQSQGREIFFYLRETFNIELLYKDAKETLYSLFKYQENANSKKDSLLLLILTLYSVMGQMMGMSFVIPDFIGKIKWNHLLHYNPIEFLGLFVGASGILVSIYLGIHSLHQWSVDRKNREKWVEQTVLSSIKEKRGTKKEV